MGELRLSHLPGGRGQGHGLPHCTSKRHNGRVAKWLTLRNLLVLVLLLWNGYFLAALIYELIVQSPSRSTVIAVIAWLWVLGDLAILLGSWALRAILRARASAA